MKKTNILSLVLIFISISYSSAEKIILSYCENNKDGFIKNEYILDLEQSLMTRNYVFNDKTFKQYKITDLSVKKKNKIERLIYQDGDKILTEKLGYPQFYTQLVFEQDSPEIKIKTVINNEEGINLLSTCKKIERFKEEG
jgi:hypothetical protein